MNQDFPYIAISCSQRFKDQAKKDADKMFPYTKNNMSAFWKELYKQYKEGEFNR